MRVGSLLARLASTRQAPKGRVYISGTGRAGTTFIVQLLTDLGLDTGFDQGGTDMVNPSVYFERARAGYERDVLNLEGPRFVKNPYLCDMVDDVLAAGIRIEHVLIPIRNLKDAAASRVHVQRATTGSDDGAAVAGGLWGTARSEEQERILGLKLATLIEALVRNEIPMTFLSFPRFAQDSAYCYRKLKFLLDGISGKQFESAFAARSRPDLIHSFEPPREG